MKKRLGKPISIAIFTHEKVGQMLDHRPLWIHRHVILIGQKPAHVRHAHSFVYEQAFATPVQGERFDEQLLNAGFAHLLQRQPDLLCLHSARSVFPCDESTEALKRRTSEFSFKNEKKNVKNSPMSWWDCCWGPVCMAVWGGLCPEPLLLAELSLDNIDTVSENALSLSGLSVRIAENKYLWY